VGNRKNRVCPVKKAGSLDNRIRRWIQNPRKILGPYIEAGMTVLDIGCGPGFFSIEAAEMVGKAGRVIAADLQQGMLDKLRDKIRGTTLEQRITLHKCQEDRIGVSANADFILLFYIVHEVPNTEELFNEVTAILKPEGKVLIVEPPFHVSRTAFEQTVGEARDAGLTEIDRPKLFFSKTVLLKKAFDKSSAET
jgi:ubiquinone/menaquinone biosynthesis C-methylase UbiE